jgi:hypothetical protein
MDKNQRVQAEIGRLSDIFKDLPSQQVKLAKPLIERAGFMKVSLEDLEKDISENGEVIAYDNGGGQKGIRTNPAVNIYTTTVKIYAAIIKQLAGLSGEFEPEEEDELMKFIKRKNG